jgi:hypothetical protein
VQERAVVLGEWVLVLVFVQQLGELREELAVTPSF